MVLISMRVVDLPSFNCQMKQVLSNVGFVDPTKFGTVFDPVGCKKFSLRDRRIARRCGEKRVSRSKCTMYKIPVFWHTF